MLRPATPADTPQIHAVINDGATAYRGVIPEDCWHEPYMSMPALQTELDAGVRFRCEVEGDELRGVMGSQDKGEVVLIRHAYVRSSVRRLGIGSRLLQSPLGEVDKPVRIGTWQAAGWAIDFYRGHGFDALPAPLAQTLLCRYWQVPPRQRAMSVVLADRRFRADPDGAGPGARPADR